jgi:hypothetical protein
LFVLILVSVFLALWLFGSGTEKKNLFLFWSKFGGRNRGILPDSDSCGC